MKLFKKFFVCMATLATVVFGMQNANAQQEARWLRNPAISPDGTQIAFGFMGNIYLVSVDGGVAIPITSGDNYSCRPVWSRDGKMIAYASDVYGNMDVFVMPAKGGVPTRLTYNSAADYPYDFTADNKSVLFGSSRLDPAESVQFPSSGNFLYTVPVNGGRPILLSAVASDEAKMSEDGSFVLFQDKKGYEDAWRKHHTSAVTRDILRFDVASKTYTKVTTADGDDLSPVLSADGKSVYYTNEKSGAHNLYKRDLATGEEKKMTSFKDFPVREVSGSKSGKLAFVWKGDIYTIADGQKAKKLDVKVTTNAGYQKLANLSINDCNEMAVSPNGKEVAIINRGELFVASTTTSRTKRITNTPYQERMVNFSPDGKAIYYSAEVDGNWCIMKATLKDTTEKYFYNSTLVNIEKVVADGKDNFAPDISPDGKKLAYICERNTLKVMDLKSKKTVTVLPEGHNHSYRDGDWGFEWSPDSKWILFDDERNQMRGGATALVSADGGEIRYPYEDITPNAFRYGWSLDGKGLTYSDGSGVYLAFFSKADYDRFMLSKDDFELLTEKEKAEKAEKEKAEKVEKEKAAKKDGKKDDKKEAKKDDKKDDKPIAIELDGIKYRVARLASNTYSYALTKDCKKLYYLVRGNDRGMDLWSVDTRSREPKRLGNVGNIGGMKLSKDEKSLFALRNGSPVKIDVNSGMVKPIAVSGKMSLDAAAEREYMFQHMWLQVVKKFYDPKIHGIDWKMYRDEYAKFLPYINNNYDFQVLISELLGELNASHTGGRYYAARDPKNRGGDATANLGMFFDETYTGEGIKVTGVIPGGPADKLANKISAGDIITAINGEVIPAGVNYNKYLNNLANTNTLLTVKSGDKTFKQVIRPVALRALGTNLYDRWTSRMEKMTDSLSNGQIGYVHVQGMDQASYRVVYNYLMGKGAKKKACIIDTRHNGGGWLHDDLVTLLSGKRYLNFAPQGNLLDDGEPLGRWTKPSAVLTCEDNYSDAFIFPFVYQQNKVGKVYGMPVAGTGTAVWWETMIDPTIVFGIPMIATMGLDGVVTENTQFEPDVKVALPYEAALSGKDPQLEAAVKGLLQEVK